jgi:hypothetical protein
MEEVVVRLVLLAVHIVQDLHRPEVRQSVRHAKTCGHLRPLEIGTGAVGMIWGGITATLAGCRVGKSSARAMQGSTLTFQARRQRSPAGPPRSRWAGS